jgi:hypothetical protein
MKRIVLCMITVIVSIGLLSGCSTTNQQGNHSVLDSDGDGFRDSTDAFPTDANLHEVVTVYEGYTQSIPDASASDEIEWNVSSDSKYIFVNFFIEDYHDNKVWQNIGPLDDPNIVIHIDSPVAEYTFEGTYDPYYEGHRFTVTTENWGSWNLWVSNLIGGGNGENEAIRAWLTIYIYK